MELNFSTTQLNVIVDIDITSNQNIVTFNLLVSCVDLVQLLSFHKIFYRTMTTNIDMRLASNRVSNTIPYTENAMPRLFTPGEVITSQQGFMRYVFVQSMCHSISVCNFFFFHSI